MSTRTRTLLLIVACGVLLFSGFTLISHAATITCPEDDSGAYFTGKTRTSQAGKLLKQYKCNSYGHLFWVKA